MQSVQSKMKIVQKQWLQVEIVTEASDLCQICTYIDLIALLAMAAA